MSLFLDEISDQLNLRWAWEKVRREATPGDIWFDEVELAGFDLELERNLESIAKKFRKGVYRLKPIKPIPFPKHPNKQKEQRIRQAFQVSIRDQVAWIALINTIGPYVDSKMPSWSYGNRLFRSIWIEEDEEGRKCRKIGRYRHSSGQLYLPFRQSWPVFRRHVYLATRAMTTLNDLPEMDDRTKEEYEFQVQLDKERRCPFVMREYWETFRSQEEKNELFWCSIDLEKFYPTLKLSTVRRNIVEQLPEYWRTDADRLLNSMLRFRLDVSEWTKEELEKINLTPDRQNFTHVPTGLYVAGFLANAGLLKIDTEVSKRLTKKRISHFRFVDDHILLSYNMKDLIEWVGEYEELLHDAETGARINPEKIEPTELAEYFAAKKRKRKNVMALYDAALIGCRLDPQFPSPLMTKTLALVSGIARTDFNLLEANELEALTDQLEHLLLIDLREEEIPVKTRLSFAASRLTQVVACRLANNESLAELGCKMGILNNESDRKDLGDDKRQELEQEREILSNKIKREEAKQKSEVNRAFQLVRKVLRERPDRVRLWTRAVLMCRLTGVKGLTELFDDIRRVREKNQMSADYLYANMLALLGSQSIVATRILQDENVVHWRKKAAESFLMDVHSTEMEAPDKNTAHWFLRLSWNQYCFGLYCSKLILQNEETRKISQILESSHENFITVGKHCSENGSMGHCPTKWAWWAGRKTLRDLKPQASYLVEALGRVLYPSRETYSFWRFFPFDVPVLILQGMSEKKQSSSISEMLDGWWYDALRNNQNVVTSFHIAEPRSAVKRVLRILQKKRKKTISLYEWCDYLRKLIKGGSTDPRVGEWTALEIVQQIGKLISKESTLVDYIKNSKSSVNRLSNVHPANFRVPQAWLMIGKKEPTWDIWQNETQKSKITGVPKTDQIKDNRYTPLKHNSPLFRSVNPVRGLGLLLYGLLRRGFDLPAMWNGPGHSDVLGMLPKLLLTDITTSSWTLGILQGCLQSRVTENLFLCNINPVGVNYDDDTLLDPRSFCSAREVVSAIMKCQTKLVDYQLSTLEHRARQLTPVSIHQLTEPDWNKVFRDETSREGMHE